MSIPHEGETKTTAGITIFKSDKNEMREDGHLGSQDSRDARRLAVHPGIDNTSSRAASWATCEMEIARRDPQVGSAE
jgi:hypothetical protein